MYFFKCQIAIQFWWKGTYSSIHAKSLLTIKKCCLSEFGKIDELDFRVDIWAIHLLFKFRSWENYILEKEVPSIFTQRT